jgi:hypothetical protein
MGATGEDAVLPVLILGFVPQPNTTTLFFGEPVLVEMKQQDARNFFPSVLNRRKWLSNRN